MELSKEEQTLILAALSAVYSFIGNSPMKVELGQLIKKLNPKTNHEV